MLKTRSPITDKEELKARKSIKGTFRLMVIENMTMYHSLLALKECIRAMDNNKSGGSKYY